MTATIIGISLGIVIIMLFIIFKQFDKKMIYGQILTAIGFLYVGFAWNDAVTLVINSIQAIAFLLLAYFGIKGRLSILALGFFLHGCWDMTYKLFRDPAMIPPHYDWFCLSIDYVFCIYILIFKKQFAGVNTGA